MTWILVLYIYAGAFAKGDSVTLTSVQFDSEISCKAAGEKASALVEGSFKSVRYMCVKK
jgi:hypothetical protein